MSVLLLRVPLKIIHWEASPNSYKVILLTKYATKLEAKSASDAEDGFVFTFNFPNILVTTLVHLL